MIFAFGKCEVDDTSYELRVRGQPVSVQRRVLDVLLHLLRHRDRVILKDELLRQVWAGIHVSDNALPQAISSLRAAFVMHGLPAPITTLRGRGYRFTAVVEERVTIHPGLRDCERLAALLRGALAGLHGGVVVHTTDTQQIEAAVELLGGPTLIRASAWKHMADVDDEAAGQASSSVALADAFVRALERRAAAVPLVVVLEHLDRADLASLLFFLYLLARPRPNLALVATVDLETLSGEGDVARALRGLAWRPAQAREPTAGENELGSSRAHERANAIPIGRSRMCGEKAIGELSRALAIPLG